MLNFQLMWFLSVCRNASVDAVLSASFTLFEDHAVVSAARTSGDLVASTVVSLELRETTRIEPNGMEGSGLLTVSLGAWIATSYELCAPCSDARCEARRSMRSSTPRCTLRFTRPAIYLNLSDSSAASFLIVEPLVTPADIKIRE